MISRTASPNTRDLRLTPCLKNYNLRYNNLVYSRLRIVANQSDPSYLAASLRSQFGQHEDVTELMNVAIDAALELCGMTTRYRGAVLCACVMAATMGDEVLSAMDDWLSLFL